jgi:DNA-binding transcriptional ArsR family regulator
MKAETTSTAERAAGRKTIWAFTPGRTDPRDLEFIFVQRQKLLQDAVEQVRESTLADHKHHLLFVGPRGCGKTHLVTLIVSRLIADAELTERLRIAWLNEDETCTTLLELLLKIHSALEKRYPEEYRRDMLSAAYDMNPNSALDFMSKHLLSVLGSRTLLVAVENLDAIFDGLGEVGQKQLRALIQENPKFSIVATAQRLVEDLSNRTSPFFGFFQTEHLKPVNVQEATELLQNIARLHEKSSVVEFLSTNRGRSRVRALHHLSGGNHRIYIVLSQFITRDSIDALVGPFLEMVDELTPYYQERVRWLPPLQRKIVEYLCSCEGTVPVKEIAKRLFATPQTISSQLQDLREKGYVEANQRGRESLYEISEPLMRICVEVKENQRHQPLRLLVDFLRVWYDEKELKLRLGKTEPASASYAYLESAIQKNSEGNLRKQIFLEDLQLSLPEKMSPSEGDGLLRELKNEPEAVALSVKYWLDGNKTEARKCLDEAIAEESAPSSKSDLLLSRGQLNFACGEAQNALEDYSAVIGLPGAPVEQVANALLYRGIAQGQAGETQRAIEDYTALIGLSGAPVKQVAMALLYRGITLFKNRRKHESESDFQALISLPAAPAKEVVYSYLALSELYCSEGRWSEGFQALEAGLQVGAKAQPAYHGSATDIVGVVFSAGLSPEGRRDKVSDLLGIYMKYQALPVLGEAVVQHIGSVFQAGEPFPSADNLEGWASAWEQAAESVDGFRLSLRLLRTGIDVVKARGKDPGILLDLMSTERAILEQALGLAKKDHANSM